MGLLIKFKDNAASSLAVPLSLSDTTLTLASNGGSKFPVITSGSANYFFATLYSVAHQYLEIIKVTATVGDVWTVIRGYGPQFPAQTFSAGDTIELRLPAEALDDFSASLSSDALYLSLLLG